MRFLIFFMLNVACNIIIAQPPEDKKELFSEGVYFFNREDFSEASYYFKLLTDKEPENCHYNFRLGECYMNITGREELAVPYFEKAIMKTVEKKKYRYGDVNETDAPLHALFYLGNVYRVAGRLVDALDAYNRFINSPYYEGNYNINIVENEVKSCENAKIIMESPIAVTIQPLEIYVNTTASEINPVVSTDENTIIFIRKLKFYDAILMVTKQGNEWSTPVNLNPQIGSDGDFYPVSLSRDCNSLFLVRNSIENKDIYVSHKVNNVWTKARSLGKAINSPADETWASLSADGRILWFTSSRKGGVGGQDIYYAIRDRKNEWSGVKNAGKIINTRFDEESPCISGNDDILYFSSKGHSGMGGYDIFYSIRDGKTWTKPVNIGYPVNNTTDNAGYIPVGKGINGYYSFEDLDSGNDHDIYRVSFKNTPIP